MKQIKSLVEITIITVLLSSCSKQEILVNHKYVIDKQDTTLVNVTYGNDK